MINRLSYFISSSTNPYLNLAVEEYLLETVKPNQLILYLWQNERTVVIGKNQNAWKECDLPAMERDGVRLARRVSGGGAVYHDLGNLNFTFLTCRGDYDVARQTEVILQAVRALGIPAEKNGRNDLTVDGQKFSGHAYYQTGDQCYHHGTLMVSVDLAPLEGYLNVSPLKLQAKGVASVRARVGNLADFCPGLTIPRLRQALVEAFGQVYGLPVHTMTEGEADPRLLAQFQAQFSDPAWTYGDSPHLDTSREARFAWGTLRLDYSQAEGHLTQAALWSDGLEGDFLRQVPQALAGCPWQRSALEARLLALPGADPVTDILTLLLEEETP